MVFPFLAFLVIHMIFVFDRTSQDRIYISKEIKNRSAPSEGSLMNISGDVKLDFKLMVNNNEFDNDDNPYGMFLFHMFTNMQTLNDTATEFGPD